MKLVSMLIQSQSEQRCTVIVLVTYSSIYSTNPCLTTKNQWGLRILAFLVFETLKFPRIFQYEKRINPLTQHRANDLLL